MVAREFNIPNVEGDWRALVARDDIDLVSVVTPVFTHFEMTLAALAQRKAVLCEKPMAMNADEARRMTESAREAGVLALIDHELRFLPGRRQMHDSLRRGDIGKVRHAKLTFRADSRADVNRPWNWWSDKTKGGGTLGAYLGMRLFRHKTIKGMFRIVFWTVVVLQLALIAALVKRIWFAS